MPVAVGLEPFALMLLTIKDGQGVPVGMGGLLRVTVTSGAGPDAQAVPQGASTVDYCPSVTIATMIAAPILTCAFVAMARAAKANVPAKNFIVIGTDA